MLLNVDSTMMISWSKDNYINWCLVDFDWICGTLSAYFGKGYFIFRRLLRFTVSSLVNMLFYLVIGITSMILVTSVGRCWSISWQWCLIIIVGSTEAYIEKWSFFTMCCMLLFSSVWILSRYDLTSMRFTE